MANEITLGYRSGVLTLTYGVYDPDGSVVTAAGTALNEEGSTGYYHATNGDIAAGDIVIIKEGTDVVAWGEYLPEVVSSDITTDLTTISGKLDSVITTLGIQHNVYPEKVEIPRLEIY